MNFLTFYIKKDKKLSELSNYELFMLNLEKPTKRKKINSIDEKHVNYRVFQSIENDARKYLIPLRAFSARIGGQYSNVLQATDGIGGEPSWFGIDNEPDMPGNFTVCEIKDLTASVTLPTAIIIESDNSVIISMNDMETLNLLIDKINSKSIDGIITAIECYSKEYKAF